MMTTGSNDPPDQGGHPPKPPFALSIGVVGHRPKRLPAKADARYGRIEAEVSRMLTEISREARVVCDRYYEFFAKESQASLALSLVTALAEGADTIAAKAADAQGYAVDIVLPFPKTEYQRDFKGAALDEFDALYDLGRAKLTLPGMRRDPADPNDAEAKRAYEAAGLTVVGNCDVVLAVWDGGESGGRGGTTEMLVAAASLGIPIIHVDAGGSMPTLVKWSGLDKFPIQVDKLDALPAMAFEAALPRLMDELARPPDEPAERARLRRYFDERFCSWNLFLAFPLLRNLLWVRRLRWLELHPDSPETLSKKFLKLLQPAVDKGSPPPDLLQAYAWADAIGLHFAQVFRSAFVLNFLVASFAVAAALMSLLTPPESVWPAGVEIAMISMVVLNTWIGRHLNWHNRWTDSREVAERLRVAAMLWVLGTRPRAFAGAEPAWTGWYTRAIVRAQELRRCCFTGATIDDARAVTIDILHDQCSYHETSAHRMKSLERRLEWMGLVLFISTVLVALDHFFFKAAYLHCLVHDVLPDAWPAHEVGIGLSAVLPALATATYGIRVIGDFEGTAKRSERAHKSLSDHIAALRQDPPDLEVLRRRARAAGEAMLGDVSSWRLAVESRGLAIPG